MTKLGMGDSGYEDNQDVPFGVAPLDELRQEAELAARAVAELKREVHRAIGNMEYAAFNLCESMNLDSKHGGRTVETTCPEKSLLIAIRDLKEATGAG